ncbi:MAG: RagB/SusD family nutrient uptake outer membrane protein, partial [Bacteroidales bacterium]|nr:RagB/SusD family nutrient uptake outer membrane protein [Bacteroidales bacterium]
MKKILLIFCIVSIASGCGFLEEDPRDQVPGDMIVTDSNSLYLTTLGNLYSMFGSDETGEGLMGTYRGIYDLGTFTTDEAIIPTRGGDWYDGGLWQRLFLHTWETGEAPLKNAWNYLYKVI